MIKRTQLIRLAHANPDIQPKLLQAIEQGLEFKTAEDLTAWVKSVPATPKVASAEERAEEKEASTEAVTACADPQDWTSHLSDGLLDNSDAGMMLGDGPDIVQSYLTPDDGSNIEAAESPFRTVRASAVPGKVCPDSPPEGLHVLFANTIEAMMSYNDSPEPGTKGKVISARTDGRVSTSYDGRVFVKFEDGKSRAIVASHLVVSEKQPQKKGKTASRSIRVASIDDLLNGLYGDYVKIAEDTLVHRATKDLWSLHQDAGGYVIERLFNDNGSPLKLAGS